MVPTYLVPAPDGIFMQNLGIRLGKPVGVIFDFSDPKRKTAVIHMSPDLEESCRFVPPSHDGHISADDSLWLGGLDYFPVHAARETFTFGTGIDPVTGIDLRAHYAQAPTGADWEKARAWMIAHFGRRFAFQYPNASEAGAIQHNLTPLRVEAPAYIACAGGPLDRQWFTFKDWQVRVLAVVRTGVGPAADYQPTGAVIEHPRGDLKASVREWKS